MFYIIWIKIILTLKNNHHISHFLFDLYDWCQSFCEATDIKNSPIRGWGGLSKMSNKMSKMSIIELSWLGQDLFDFSGLTWTHPLTHPSTHR